MKILDKQTLLNDFGEEKNGCLVTFFTVCNALLLAGIVGIIIWGIRADELFIMQVVLAGLLFFFTGNTIAVVYEVNHRKVISKNIQNDHFAILKARFIGLEKYYDTSGDTATTSLFMEFEYHNGKCKFTWTASPAFGFVAYGQEYYVLMKLKKRNLYHPINFYLADPEHGYGELGADIIECYIDEPVNIDRKYALPHYNNNGLTQ